MRHVGYDVGGVSSSFPDQLRDELLCASNDFAENGCEYVFSHTKLFSLHFDVRTGRPSMFVQDLRRPSHRLIDVLASSMCTSGSFHTYDGCHGIQ